MEASQVSTNLLDQFPEEVQDSVEGLSFLGYLESEFDFCGHNFVIRTLKGDDELHAAAVAKEYQETIGEAKAWIWAQVALALTAVDGDEDFCPPVGPDKRNFARARFQYVTQNWYWPLGEYLYAQYNLLQQKQLAALDAVRDLSDRDLRTSSPLADSSKDPGISANEIDSETPPSA